MQKTNPTESQNTEWKQSWRDEYLKWICGFANAQGGRIYIGKDDSGQVVGLQNAQKLLADLPNKIRDHLGLMPQVNLLNEDDKSYIEIVVESSTVPISLRGSYYWRSGSTKQELKGPALTDFLLKKMGMTWDRVIEEKATLNDIDDFAIEQFKKDAAKAGRLPDLSDLSSEKVLKKLRLLTRDGLTKAALVLFGKDPGEFYPNLFVKIGRFGLSDVDLRFQEVCEGSLILMLRDVMEQLEKKFLTKPIRFEGIQRIEELEYPVAALREMLLNALVHRNYLGSMTQMKVYDGRLTLWNAGILPEELTIEQLFQVHESIPRNPLLAEVCYKAGYIDSWGRGVEKIAAACKEAGLPDPQFIERTGGVVVELVRPSEKSVGKASGKRRESVGKASGKILGICRENPSVTITEMAALIGITERSIQRNIQKLQNDGFLRRVGGRKSGHWEVQDG
ncbi:MAG: transcriptional regulator [Deltaproteobacteria bacterium]|nr:MAG: transcriptional regulator [Deltaproteobacteria bacterium]